MKLPGCKVFTLAIFAVLFHAVFSVFYIFFLSCRGGFKGGGGGEGLRGRTPSPQWFEPLLACFFKKNLPAAQKIGPKHGLISAVGELEKKFGRPKEKVDKIFENV